MALVSCEVCMTNDEILQAAKKAGFHFYDAGHVPILHTVASEYSQMCFERFAAIIERQTIERCEALLMQLHESHKRNHNHFHYAALQVAAIRKLGEQ